MAARNPCWRGFAVLAGLWLNASAIFGAPPVEREYQLESAGGWVIKVFCKNQGTPSETRHGTLMKDGVPVGEADVGQTVLTGFDGRMARMRYFGSAGSTTGWYFADVLLACGDLPYDEQEEGK